MRTIQIQRFIKIMLLFLSASFANRAWAANCEKSLISQDAAGFTMSGSYNSIATTQKLLMNAKYNRCADEVLRDLSINGKVVFTFHPTSSIYPTLNIRVDAMVVAASVSPVTSNDNLAVYAVPLQLKMSLDNQVYYSQTITASLARYKTGTLANKVELSTNQFIEPNPPLIPLRAYFLLAKDPVN